jgi:DNA polymerase I
VLPTNDGWNPTIRYVLVDNEPALSMMVDTIRAYEHEGTAWDTETTGKKPELGARICGHCFASRTGESELTGWYVPIRHTGPFNEHEPQLDPKLVSERLAPLFKSGGGELVTYHGKFDGKMARADGIELERPWVDIAIEATAFNENEQRFALKTLAEKYCSPAAKGELDAVTKWAQKDAKKLGLSFKKHSKEKRAKLGLDAMITPTYLDRFGYARVPIKLIAPYGIHDAVYTWWLHRVKYHKVRASYPDLWQREHDVGRMLMDMEWYGLRADETQIRDTHDRTKAAVEFWLARCIQLSNGLLAEGFEATERQLQKLLYEDLRLAPLRLTKKSESPSVDKVSRKLLAKRYPKHAPLLEALDQYATVQKLHSTYAGNYLAFYSPTTKSIHPSYNQLEGRQDGGAPVTGRLSSADPNCQNVASSTLHLHDCHCGKCLKQEAKAADAENRYPTKSEDTLRMRVLKGLPVSNTVSVRRYFVVPEGWIRLYIDFSQIELRVLAWFCQDPNLLHAYQNDLDVHQMVADQLEILRKIAKQVNFGNSYGMTEKGLALRMPGYYDDPEATEEQAKQVLRDYFQKYKDILVFRRRFANEMRRNGCMFVNPFGRPRRIPQVGAQERWIRERGERMMMSSIISGTSADLMKESMRRTWPIATKFGGRLVQTIHDELVFDLPRKPGWSKVLVELVRTMEDWPMFSDDSYSRKGVPIKVSAELTTTSWEDKREITVHPDGSFAWAA